VRHATPGDAVGAALRTLAGDYDLTCGLKADPHRPPTRKPLCEVKLTGACGGLNSRFFTNCYLDAAVFAPPLGRKSTGSGADLRLLRRPKDRVPSLVGP